MQLDREPGAVRMDARGVRLRGEVAGNEGGIDGREMHGAGVTPRRKIRNGAITDGGSRRRRIAGKTNLKQVQSVGKYRIKNYRKFIFIISLFLTLTVCTELLNIALYKF